MSIELINKDHYSIEIERKEDRVNILLVENEAFGERILVGAEERKEFLTPWINMLIRHKKEAGIKGTMDLARKLEHIARFEKGKQEKGFLTLKSINTDIINLRKAFLEKEEEAKKRKKISEQTELCKNAFLLLQGVFAILNIIPYFAAPIRRI